MENFVPISVISYVICHLKISPMVGKGQKSESQVEWKTGKLN